MNTDTHTTKRSTKRSVALPLKDWSEINWFRIENYVRKLQQRIYRAESEGKSRKVRQLQRLLMRSQAALLLSIKRVTQENKGKRTAGVDGMKVLSPTARMKLYNEMNAQHLSLHKPKPARRTYIPKKNKKLRPLGIPVIKDRVWQNVAKLALEPQWEAKFESVSYGFRPKRSIHDAVAAIYVKLNGQHNKKLWVFEGDFEGCFDNLNHNYIIDQLNNFPNVAIILKWLKAGYVDNKTFHPTEMGTPQGGIISPLLANIALHGMEKEIGVRYKYNKPNKHHPEGSVEIISKISMVRYADDFVILCESKEEAESMYEKLKPYLSKRGLTLATDKTKVTHITEGFDFLGFTFRKFETQKRVKGKGGTTTAKIYYKTIVKPSKESVKKTNQKVKEIFTEKTGTNVEGLIKRLNPVIVGIANNWKHVVSSKTKSSVDDYIWKKTWKFLRRLHPTKSAKWIRKRYFRPDVTGQSKDRWILSSPTKKYNHLQLKKMSWTGFKQHDLIKFKHTPFDSTKNDYFYIRDRNKFNNNNIASRQKHAKKQKYRCPLCGLSLTRGDEGHEVHHKTPKIQGGEDTYENLQLVHISCHIEHHRIFPAKGPIPTEKQLKAHKKRLAKLKYDSKLD